MTTPDEIRFEVTQEHFNEAASRYFKKGSSNEECLFGTALSAAGFTPVQVGYSLFRLETEPGRSVCYKHFHAGLVNRFCSEKDVSGELPLTVVAKRFVDK